MSLIRLPLVPGNRNLLPAITAGVESVRPGASDNLAFGAPDGLFGSGEEAAVLSDGALSAGEAIFARVQARYDKAANVKARIRQYDSSITLLDTQETAFIPANGANWVDLSLSATVVAKAVKASIWVVTDDGGDAGVDLAARRGMISRASSPVFKPPYAGPSFAGQSFDLLRGDEALEFASGATQVTAFSKALWATSWRMPPLSPKELDIWRSRLSQLSTFDNTFEMSPPEFISPRSGYEGAEPLVAGASQLGLSLNVDGASNDALLLKEGDYFSVLAAGKRELKIITSEVWTSGTGTATLNFTPALRNAPSDDAVIEIFAPRAEFRFVQPLARWGLDSILTGDVAVDAIEAFAP